MFLLKMVFFAFGLKYETSTQKKLQYKGYISININIYLNLSIDSLFTLDLLYM